MKNFLILSFLLIIGIKGFGQETQISKDFIKDKDGNLGLRAKYIKKEYSVVTWRFEFKEILLFDYFEGKSKKEIIELFGTPNQIIDVITKVYRKEISVKPYDVKVDKIVYFISHSDEKCDNTYICGFPAITGNAEDFEKDKIKSVSIKYYFDCEDKINKDRKEQIVELQFEFYLGDKK